MSPAFLLFVCFLPKLKRIETGIDSVLLHQLFVRAFFGNAVFGQHQNAVGVMNGGKAMGDHKGGAVLRKAF